MRKIKKMLLIIGEILFILNAVVITKTFAISIEDSFQRVEYTDEFKEWLELPDEEKEKVLMPRMYNVENTTNNSTSPLYIAKMLKASMNSRFSLKDVIPSNLSIRNQMNTGSCWTFAALSSLETNLALSNYKNGINTDKVYDFSERHMEYANSQSFLNNASNSMGYNRKVGSGGVFQMAESYLTNGTGAILESEMPFENNENDIDISYIKNKTVSSQVYDTVYFPNYAKETGEKRVEIMNQIKQHIQNYGSVFAGIHGNSSSSSAFNCYNNETGAKYCNSSNMHAADHAVSIVGWDDNYSIENFPESAKPTSNGAWIVRNSWGERAEYNLSELKEQIFNAYKQQCIAKGWNSASEIPNEFIEQIGYTIENDIVYIKCGDNGYIYVSYEDVNVSKRMSGIEKAVDTVNYDYIYQYDELYPAEELSITFPKIMLANIFNKKSSGSEYLTQVSLCALETYTCKVYVNPNGTSKSKNDLQLIQLKAGETETFNAGYHTLEFSKPVEIKGNSFVVVVEIQGAKSNLTLPIESKIAGAEKWDLVKVESGKCFIALGSDLSNCEWADLGKMTEIKTTLSNGDSSIKAYTTTELNDESLKNIEITTPPNKTVYLEGENFDKTGMVVKANYNSKTKPSVVLNDSDYNITNGTDLQVGQTSVTITYEDKSITQAITVKKNSVVGLTIKTPPTKTEYKEGEIFDKNGMVVEATYEDGTTKTITDYVILNGNNLKNNQTSVTIKYEEKAVEQSVTVIPNPLLELIISKAPNKTKYVVGQNFDKTGMIVSGRFQDDSIVEILDYTIENGNNLTKSQTSVTIKYDEKTVTQEITVEEKTIIEIVISQKPTKTQYIQYKENLDLTGGLLKLDYNDETSEEIDLKSEQVKISGFDNSKIGKNIINVTYQEKNTTFEIEIIMDEVPENSKFDNANSSINSSKYFTFTDKNKKEYMIIDLVINNIVKGNNNDSYEYYYFLSANKDEKDINDWIKIAGKQITDNKLSFEINTKDIKKYEELASSNVLYVYIKEVAVKGGNQAIEISKAIELKSDGNIETYLDDKKVDIINNDPNSGNNKPNELPYTGIRGVLIILGMFIIGSAIFYVKYKNLKRYIK